MLKLCRFLFIFIVILSGLNSQAWADVWTNELVPITIFNKVKMINAAVYKHESLTRNYELSISCRNSFPNPSIFIKMPFLSTDIIEPYKNATVTFYDYDFSKKRPNGKSFVLNAIVKEGDLVFIPTGNDNQLKVLQETYDFLNQNIKNQHSEVFIYFNQNKHSYKLVMHLLGFKEIFENMQASCNELVAPK